MLRVARAGAFALVLVTACESSTDDQGHAREWTPLVAALDLDPDPDVVEIDLVAEVASVELVPGIATEVWAYRDAGDPSGEARVPGPAIEAELGDRLIVHLRNELPQGTTLHWHGLRLPDTMDGNPMVGGTIGAGESATAEFVLRDEGLHWYHPHVYADEQIQRGLQGTLVVRGPDEPDADVERVLVLDDVMLDDEGSIVLEPTSEDLMLGRRGNALLVNGTIPAIARAAAGSVERWRLVNTSNGRYFALGIGDIPFTVVGWDGGPVAEPYETAQLVIAPGERYDVLVPIIRDDGDRLLLETHAFGRGRGAEDPGPFTLLELDVIGRANLPGTIDAPSRTLATIDIDDATQVQRFELRHETGLGAGAVFTINDQRWPLNTPVHVDHGDTEIWEVVNEGDHDHPFHLHGLRFQVLDRDGVAEPTLGWKDTVRVAPRGTTRLAVTYEEPGMWMFHCTIPEHAERGMMGDLMVMLPK